MFVTIYCWREKNGGADFHARHLLTKKGGIGIDAGFSAEGNHQTTDVHLMSFKLSQEKIRPFTRLAIGDDCGCIRPNYRFRQKRSPSGLGGMRANGKRQRQAMWDEATCIAACCARAANGHAVAAPPRSVMNSRRFMSIELSPHALLPGSRRGHVNRGG
jgi:hypothetical protein